MADNPNKGSGDPRSSAMMPLHKQLAQGKPVDTGAGKGASGGKDSAPTRW